MEIPNEEQLCAMEGKELRNALLSLEFYCKRRGLYAKDRAGTLTEKESATFGRIMELFRFARINLE